MGRTSDTAINCPAGCNYCSKLHGIGSDGKHVAGWGCGCGNTGMNVVECQTTGQQRLTTYNGDQYCCTGDYCNAAAYGKISAAVLMICLGFLLY
ncbi:unnamed protein product, partial [Mesorhabditis spiculigera]